MKAELLPYEPAAQTRKTELDRVTRYKWPPVRGHGSMVSIDKAKLRVEERYQREYNNAKATEIARDFNWLTFGALTVARRSDGSFWIIDGQTRHGAAMKRGDVQALPCIVYDAVDVTDEAEAFLNINTGRRALTSYDKFKALLVTKDDAAMFLVSSVEQAGFMITRSPRADGVRCINTCLEMIRLDRQTFSTVFGLAAAMCRGSQVDEKVLSALWYIQRNTRAFDDIMWRRAVIGLGLKSTLDAAQQAAAYYKRGGAKVWAAGVVDALNRGRRSYRITLPTGDAQEG